MYLHLVDDLVAAPGPGPGQLGPGGGGGRGLDAAGAHDGAAHQVAQRLARGRRYFYVN